MTVPTPRKRRRSHEDAAPRRARGLDRRPPEERPGWTGRHTRTPPASGRGARRGRPPTDEPFDALARQIGEAAYRVTDAQVAAVVQKVGERAAFEMIIAAAAGAGLHRWRRGLAILEQAISEEARRAPG